VAELTLTEAENGGSFAVRPGDAIVLTLPENPSTGYRWSTASLHQNFLSQEAHDYHPGGPGVGSAGTVVWRFKATREGHTHLEMKKVRSWEAGSAPIGEFAVSIEIKS
jgi:inhibitor of cysteine peptidase